MASAKRERRGRAESNLKQYEKGECRHFRSRTNPRHAEALTGEGSRGRRLMRCARAVSTHPSLQSRQSRCRTVQQGVDDFSWRTRDMEVTSGRCLAHRYPSERNDLLKCVLDRRLISGHLFHATESVGAIFIQKSSQIQADLSTNRPSTKCVANAVFPMARKPRIAIFLEALCARSR